MSAARGRALVVALLVLLSAGCGRSESNPAVHFVRDSNAPSHPPSSAFTLASVAGPQSIPGVLYTTDWSTRLFCARTDPSVPVLWPRPSFVDHQARVMLVLGTRAPPDYVKVSAFSAVTRTTGVPEGAPAATYECSRFSKPICVSAGTNAGLVFSGLSGALLDHGYVVVFCTWHLPRSQQRVGTHPADDASASWLFRIGGQGSPRRATP